MAKLLAGATESTNMIKRAFDILAASFALLALLPLLLLLAALVRGLLGSPVFFRQERPGLHGRPFAMFKFRTMRDLRDHDGRLLPDRDRITKFGKLLRSTSLDELPELWNVLRGEMSVVGPRPLLMEYLPLYNEHQFRRHEVRPGVTGWAQINGRNSLTWEEKFSLDVWYVDNHAFWLDLQIIVKTVVKVVFRSGISADGDVTMPRFEGTKWHGCLESTVREDVPKASCH
jgi:lipopolysaccharide/colanic/teichoic acid biosynthesis glycosyltransferase